MGYLRGFVPWIVSAVISSFDWRWAAVGGLASGLLLLLQDRRRGVGLDALVLEISSVVYFAAVGAVAVAAPHSALSQQLRLVLMLRHFSGITSYQEIAAACEVPVGTVRSRLSQARTKMAQVLVVAAGQTHDDASMVVEESRQEAVATLQAAERGALPPEIAELWPTQSAMTGRFARPGEHVDPRPVLRRVLEKGVRQQVRHVVASHDITIWEMDVTNPVGIEDPCPTNLVWLMYRRDRRVQKLRVVLPGPPQ